MTVRVKVYGGDSGACYWYRVVLPFYFVNENSDRFEVTISRVLKSKDARDYDVLVFARQFSQVCYNTVLEARRLGKTVLYEVDDDLLHVPRWSAAWKVYGRLKVRKAIVTFMRACDAAFVSTPHLADIYRQFFPRIYVLPNSEDIENVAPRPRNNNLPVVCWQGSNTHRKDLELLQGALQKLHGTDAFVKTFSAPELGVYDVAPVPFEGFYSLFANLDVDIGVAPLTVHRFNLGKSNLKWLQYTAVGAATVASNFGPYADLVDEAVLVSATDDWYQVVRQLLDNEVRRQELVEASRERVKRQFDIRRNWKLWEDALLECINR